MVFSLLIAFSLPVQADSHQVFGERNETTIIRTLFPSTPMATDASGGFHLKTPIQSPGDAIPASIDSLAGAVKAVAILVDDERYPLAASARFLRPVSSYRTRIRLAKSGTISVYVLVGEELYKKTSYIKVTRRNYGMDFGEQPDHVSKTTSIQTRIKVRNHGVDSDIMVQLSHPMLRGARPDEGDQISSLVLDIDKNKIADIALGQHIASNPMTRITVRNTKAGDAIVGASWKDNRGRAGGGQAKPD